MSDKQLLNPTAAMEVFGDYTIRMTESEKMEDFRQQYALCLQSIATRLTMKNSQGEFVYGIPAQITMSIESNNLDHKLMLKCDQYIQKKEKE